MKSTAFALAGLGGFNAHGAGFLQAARDNHYVPDLITATSGQILIAADYLAGKPDLRTGLIDGKREHDTFAQLKTALFGYPDVFRPAYGPTIQRFFQMPAWFTDSMVDILADRIAPAQLYEPSRTDEALQEIVDTFNDRPFVGRKEVGVIFNAYDPMSGQGVLYGNDRARDLMRGRGTRGNLPVDPTADARYGADALADTHILPITLQALKSALWLSLYGFEGLPDGKMDGAYHRSCILSELHIFPRVMVARPLANGWLDDRPRNWFDVQDWQCEMWFSVGYQAEVDAMKRINAMIEKGYVKEERIARDGTVEAGKLNSVDLIEIAPPTPAGYFNFFIERAAVFDRAYALADAEFRRLAKEEGNSDDGDAVHLIATVGRIGGDPFSGRSGCVLNGAMPARGCAQSRMTRRRTRGNSMPWPERKSAHRRPPNPFPGASCASPFGRSWDL